MCRARLMRRCACIVPHITSVKASVKCAGTRSSKPNGRVDRRSKKSGCEKSTRSSNTRGLPRKGPYSAAARRAIAPSSRARRRRAFKKKTRGKIEGKKKAPRRVPFPANGVELAAAGAGQVFLVEVRRASAADRAVHARTEVRGRGRRTADGRNQLHGLAVDGAVYSRD